MVSLTGATRFGLLALMIAATLSSPSVEEPVYHSLRQQQHQPPPPLSIILFNITRGYPVVDQGVAAPQAGNRGWRFFTSGSPTEWVDLAAVVVVLCLLDVLVMQRLPNNFQWHLISILVWIAVAGAYAVFVWLYRSPAAGTVWITGYVLEWILSMDNLFVFHLVFEAYRTPANQIHKAVFVGIVGAVAMRLVFFMVLSSLLHLFHWVRFVFGAFLIWSGVEAARSEDDDGDDITDTRLVRSLKWFLGARLMDDYDHKGGAMFMHDSRGRVRCTMLFVVICCLEFTDIIFAVDSVSAKVSQIPSEYLAFSSSVLAMFGLRAMFFIINDLVQMFDMLKYGLCIILMFIGVELMISQWVRLPPGMVCLCILAVFIISIGASWFKGRYFPDDEDDKAQSAALLGNVGDAKAYGLPMKDQAKDIDEIIKQT